MTCVRRTAPGSRPFPCPVLACQKEQVGGQLGVRRRHGAWGVCAVPRGLAPWQQAAHVGPCGTYTAAPGRLRCGGLIARDSVVPPCVRYVVSRSAHFTNAHTARTGSDTQSTYRAREGGADSRNC